METVLFFQIKPTESERFPHFSCQLILVICVFQSAVKMVVLLSL